MKKLTREEERVYIKNIIEGKYTFLGHGSTRATYELDEDRVIKLTVDKDCIGQHMHEVELFEKEGSEFLAKIFEYGNRIIVAEKVAISDEDLWDELSYYLGLDDNNLELLTQENKNIIREIPCAGQIFLEKIENGINPFDEYDSVADFLSENDINEDGGQFGYNKEGRLVAYDYGLKMNSTPTYRLIGSLYEEFVSTDIKYLELMCEDILMEE